MRRFLAPFICACLCLAAPATAWARAFTLDDYTNIVSVDDPQISPDDRTIAIVVGHVNVEKDRTDREIVLVDVATGAQRVLVAGPETGDPRWSPDGTRLAYVAPAGTGSNEHDQVYLISPSGGDATVATNAKNGVDVYAWRPDGRAIAYVSQDDPANRAALERHEDLFNVVNEPFSAQRLPVPSHLWLQTLSGGNPQRLTEGAWSIYPDGLSWSSDGKYIAFTHTPDARFDSVFRARIAILDVATGRIAMPDHRWSWMGEFAPSGDRLAYSAGEHDTILIQNEVDVISIGARGIRNVAPSLDRDLASLAWTPDGGFIVGGFDHVSQALWRVSPSGVSRHIDLGNLSTGSADVGRDGAIALVAASAQRPPELYYIAPGGNVPRRLTDFNAAIAALDLAPSHEFTWHHDGFLEDGALTYPLGYQRGRKYPLVLDIHGGPVDEASTTDFNPLVQLLAARGFIVFQPNYRGSDNLGFAYAHAVIGRNPIAGIGTDVVAGVRALEATTGAVDASRIGVSGWSAGGWTTSWLITHYDLWKAAVSGAAVDDALMQYTLSQIDSLEPMLFGGLVPWKTPDALEAYRDASPITYVQNVHAATLILSDTTDPRVPTPESYEFFTALRNLGKTVQFTAIPAYGHHPSDPIRNREIDRVWVDWMVKYLSP